MDDAAALASIEAQIKPILTNKLPLWKRLGVLPAS